MDLHSKSIETRFYDQQPNYWKYQNFEIRAHRGIISCCGITVQVMFSFPFCLPCYPYIDQRWCHFNEHFVLKHDSSGNFHILTLIKDGVTLMSVLYFNMIAVGILILLPTSLPFYIYILHNDPRNAGGYSNSFSGAKFLSLLPRVPWEALSNCITRWWKRCPDGWAHWRGTSNGWWFRSYWF